MKADLSLVSKADYGKIGSNTLLEQQRDKLKATGLKPYCIPVGGSNALGTWGYLMVYIVPVTEGKKRARRALVHELAY